MDDIRDRIETIRFANINTDNHHFVPEDALFQVVSESAINLSLRNFEIPIHEFPELANRIMQGARKCFAILILIGRGEAIVDFFRRDLLQPTCPDDRLPYVAEILAPIFNEEMTSLTVQRFLEKQWEFAIPVIHQQMIFRQLDRNIILPIIHKEDVGRGAMGTAFKLELHPQYHRLPLRNHKVINKQIQCRPGDDRTVFQKEIENLALLTGLKHPNIVQLYCSYMYRDTYNLFFAVADGGSLENFLKQDQGMSGPRATRVLLALAGLADAIEAMHNFTSDALNLSLSGCHHDLAPRNILVHGDSFLLADFGLSTFRAVDEDSLTMFKEVRGSYVAPECQAIHNDQLKSGQVNRASDIWSFGCILMEVVIHMLQGTTGLENFRNGRMSQISPEIDWFRFHQGPGKPNPEVERWLAMLKETEEPSSRRLADLIREMLSMDPSDRPRSKRVLKVLRGIAVVSLADTVKTNLGDTSPTDQGTERTLGFLRLDSWLVAFNKLLDEIVRNNKSETDFAFPTIVEAFQETICILDNRREQIVNHQQQSLLRYQHQRLMEALPQQYRCIAKDHLTKQVLQTCDPENMGRLSIAMLDTSMDRDVGNLIAVRHLMDLAEKGHLGEHGDNSGLSLKSEDISLKEQLGIHNFAVFKPTSEPVLVEWLRYGEEWVDEHIGLALRHRLASVVRLLHDERTAQIPGSLRCKGIFPDPSYPGFGVIYEMPLPDTHPVTLHSLLNATKGLYRPLLESRFRLSFEICRCIYTFHKLGWLHRNFHSMNVLCFPPIGAKDAAKAQNPRILGFASSRENQVGSVTNGPDCEGQLQNYHHPDYVTRHELYREEFDYYSVGLVLLEIGHWTTLSKLTDSKRFQGISEEQFQAELLTSRVPQLGLIMGTRYMEATRVCLQGGFAKSEDAKDAWYTAFKRLVLDQIPLIDCDDDAS